MKRDTDREELERSIIAGRRRWLDEWVRFLSNDAKQERERYLVQEFVVQLGLEPRLNEVQSAGDLDDPVDVTFSDARFQVKEIADPEERRHDDARQDLRRAESAEQIADLGGVGEVKDIRVSDALELMLEVASRAHYSAEVKRSSDLLFYITRPYAVLESMERAIQFEACGWRSVSCLYGARSIVLYAGRDAPNWIRELRLVPR